MKKLNDKVIELLNNILESLGFEKYRALRGESKSSRYKQSETNFKKKRVNKLYLDGQGIEKTIIPSNITDMYTKLEILSGLEFSGHTYILTEARKLKDELKKR